MRRPLACCLLGSLFLLAGCSSGSDEDAAATIPPSSTTSAPSSTTSAPASPSAAGCPAAASGQPRGVPAGADSAPTLDVDGDGRPDTLYIDDETDVGGGVVFGVQTASGANFFTDFNSASGANARSVLVADVTGEGELIALASDGREVRLYGISGCSFVPEQNVQGEQYTFDLGFTGYGTGVGCADVDGDGTRDLVGLRVTDGGTGIESTVVTLDGPRATNSDITATVADAGPAAVARARSVTCGDLTLADDGVSLGG